ncbi:NUDIX hydrolase [uncultured Tessaracoccus sp.]|uniref:NUDIX hydrolase n=1 Tax=uncultured Tessaracoccus sp. TaxID=905023 RepID=UPI002628F5BA|nr:NUDIX domain-containing protein [uncultured Tessaracoccus sp.]
MRVVGVTTPVGGPVVDFHVEHGAHPAVTLFDLGYVQLRPLSAELIDDEIVYKALVREVVPADNRPQSRFRVHVDPNEDTLVPVQRQAAYALILSERGLLGTVNSAQSHAAGVWALPGGGINPGESPSDGLLREIYEETGQSIIIDRLLALESEHWIGRSLSGRLEDFHALRFIYGGRCEHPTDPVVHDVGGSTEIAEWVPLRAWRQHHWTNSSHTLLAQYARKLWVWA